MRASPCRCGLHELREHLRLQAEQARQPNDLLMLDTGASHEVRVLPPGASGTSSVQVAPPIPHLHTCPAPIGRALPTPRADKARCTPSLAPTRRTASQPRADVPHCCQTSC